ncbi:MAG: hypothetical protein KC933_40180 [Myxococcales bacterium]|nr:hypothetical protein [Myxococcales bacterium]MCB9671569.1 hypothetical protein [Alphaproteobacteria bacterium]MCB9691841.1 hypothetical protein [Alphaproteobacteria bacterium]
MHRLQRRQIILKGKRTTAFDPDQYWFDRARRTRLARRLRVHLRHGDPVVLVTPRWSRAPGFLDDLAVDLSMGDPAVRARPLHLLPLMGLTTHQAWGWLADAVAEFCQVPLQEGPAWRAVSRRGFRTVLAELFEKAEGGRARCLMLHGLEHVNVEALQDLFEVFHAHVEAMGPDRRFNMLFAGSIDAPHFAMEGAVRAELGDYSEAEAIETLVEHLGPLEAHRLSSVVAMVGGVPAILEALGERGPDDLSRILTDRDEMWRALGPLAEEVRSAIDIVSADQNLADRLERLARKGSVEAEAEADARLSRAGLVRCEGPTTRLRTPWFADLLLAG